MSDNIAAIPLRAGSGPDDRALARVFAAYIVSATIWLVFATAVGLVVSFKFSYPDFATTPALSFGRLRAIARIALGSFSTAPAGAVARLMSASIRKRQTGTGSRSIALAWTLMIQTPKLGMES